MHFQICRYRISRAVFSVLRQFGMVYVEYTKIECFKSLELKMEVKNNISSFLLCSEQFKLKLVQSKNCMTRKYSIGYYTT